MEVKKMKIIFTIEDKKTARKLIENFRSSYIIDAKEIILKQDYAIGDSVSSPQDFIINKELEKKLAQALVNKKSQQVIYFHYQISSSFIKNIKVFFRTNNIRPTYCLFDPNKEFKKMWHLFDEIV